MAMAVAFVVATPAALMAGGPVGTAAATNSTSEELADQTVSVDNSTKDVYLTVTNTSGDNVNYTVYGVSDGLSTEVTTGQISAPANDSTTEYFAADTSSYDSYRITVSQDPSDSDNETVESIDIGKTVEQSASGGGIFGGGGGLLSPMNLLIVALIAGVLFLAGAFDPLKERISEMSE